MQWLYRRKHSTLQVCLHDGTSEDTEKSDNEETYSVSVRPCQWSTRPPAQIRHAVKSIHGIDTLAYIPFE
jgi:hypothetical protein